MANKILLDYVFPITPIEPIPAASTLFLKQACVVAKPKTGQEENVGEVFECSNMTEVAVRTDNTNAQQLFNAGMNTVFVLLMTDLALETALAANANKFFTLLISDDFEDEDIAEGVTTAAVKASKQFQDILYRAQIAGADGNDITITYVDDGSAGAETVDVGGTDIVVHMEDGTSTAQNIADAIIASEDASDLVEVTVDEGDEDDVQAKSELDDVTPIPTPLEGGVTKVTDGLGLHVGPFDGVVGVSSSDDEFLTEQAVIQNRCAFYASDAVGAKNLFGAFGSLLSNYVNWLNQQYISMDFDDAVEDLGDANSFFDNKISFVLSDLEFGNRLALFACGGKAIAAPYIIKNLQIDLQSKSLQWIAANQPTYTKKEAALLETRLQEDVINSYIARNWIAAGTVEITLVLDNFVASGAIDVAEPKALWRVFSELRQTL